MTTMSPGRSSGTSTLLDIGLEGVAVDRPVEHHGAMMPRSVSAPTKVVVFQWPCGTPTRSRSPRRQRPWRRAILVEAQVSSMKTRRSGSRSSWPSNQSSRRFRTSGRSCSLACAVFFCA